MFGFQTIDLKDEETLIAFYARKLLERKESLLEISKYMVADAYFSKISFVKPVMEAGFQVISRLRDDADLQYLFTEEQKGGKGRPKKYAGKIDFKNLGSMHVKLVSELENEIEGLFKISENRDQDCDCLHENEKRRMVAQNIFFDRFGTRVE